MASTVTMLGSGQVASQRPHTRHMQHAFAKFDQSNVNQTSRKLLKHARIALQVAM